MLDEQASRNGPREEDGIDRLAIIRHVEVVLPFLEAVRSGALDRLNYPDQGRGSHVIQWGVAVGKFGRRAGKHDPFTRAHDGLRQVRVDSRRRYDLASPE